MDRISARKESRRPRRVILIFVDGFGWGGSDPAVNPCLAYGGELLRLPGLPEGPDGPVPHDRGGWARPIDPILGVPGVPQSATGQTSLLTGVNAPGRLGRHQTGFPNPPLRELLLDLSLLKTLVDRDQSAVFLNAFRPLFFQLPRAQQLQLSATTVANLAADNRFFTVEDVAARRSLYQEFTNEMLREKGFAVPLFSPAEAGRILARQAARYDFTLFEYFQTDRAGHAQDLAWICTELQKLQQFLENLLAATGCDGQPDANPDREADTLVVLTSDHGNLEDISTKRHTLNPVPLLAWGCGAEAFVGEIADLTDVAPAISRALDPT